MRLESDDAGRNMASAELGGRAAVRAERAPLDALDHARATHYLLLANLFARAPTGALLSDIANLKGDASPLGMARLALADAARHADQSAVAKEYLDLYIGVGRGDILPYASFYLTGFLNERPLARIREHMSRLEIERRADVFEPEDHIASLFEVMAGLIGGTFEAPPGAADKFFERHLASWAPRLMADVMRAPSARFYRPVASLGAAWLEIEAEAMRLPE